MLMLAYVNVEALKKTIETRSAHFWSRSRNCLWEKGATSGNTLEVKAIKTDCDNDSLLYLVRPSGPACHTGAVSCFFRGEEKETDAEFLSDLEQLLEQRKKADSEDSYVASLYAKGLDAIVQKVGEEAVEVVIASKNEDREAFLGESADLLFHFLVLLQKKDLSLAEVLAVLRERKKEE